MGRELCYSLPITTMADREQNGGYELTTFQINPAQLCSVATDDEIVIFLSEHETVSFNREAARLIVKTLSNFVEE